MYNKTMAIVSYITLIGWIIAFISYNGDSGKNELNRYHLRQSFGLLILSFGLGVVANILVGMIGSLAYLIYIVWVLLLILWIIGVINAANEARKPMPLIGEWSEANLTFIR